MPHRPNSEAVGLHGSAPEVLSHAPHMAVHTNGHGDVNGVSSMSSGTTESYPRGDQQEYNAGPRKQMVSPIKREAPLNNQSENDVKRMRTEDPSNGAQHNATTPVHTGSFGNKPAETPSPVREAQSVTSESSTGSHAQVIRGREPLKKRKKFLDVLRRNRCKLPTQRREDGAPGLLCQVSPVSSASPQANHSERASLAPPPSEQPTVVQPSQTDESYDSREAQTLSESAKIRDTAEIAPPPVVNSQQHQVVPNFPEVLHNVLSRSDKNSSVVQWLHHGQAWRVVRWDALRRHVMPKYFPQLCQGEEQGKNGGSIDAFLWNVHAWGFDEIKDGPDVGAYSHRVSSWFCCSRFLLPDINDLTRRFVLPQLFVRENPATCRELKFPLEPSGDGSATSKSVSAGCPTREEPSSPGRTQNFLRVPSLAMSRSEGSGENRRPDSPAKHHPHWRHYPQGEYARHTSQYHEMYHPYGWHYPPVSMHPHEDLAMAGGHHHYQHPHSYPRQHGVVCPSPYDSRYPFRPHPEVNLGGPPPSIRSGRGGSRAAPTHKLGHHAAPPARPSFPVSQRGKGRGPRACRTPIPSSPGTSLSARPSTEAGILHNATKHVHLAARPSSSEVNSK